MSGLDHILIHHSPGLDPGLAVIQVADLQAAGDLAGAAVAGQEREWLVAELSRAAGQGGRSRGFADDAERARVAVTNAIRRCLDRICAVDQTR